MAASSSTQTITGFPGTSSMIASSRFRSRRMVPIPSGLSKQLPDALPQEGVLPRRMKEKVDSETQGLGCALGVGRQDDAADPGPSLLHFPQELRPADVGHLQVRNQYPDRIVTKNAQSMGRTHGRHHRV